MKSKILLIGCLALALIFSGCKDEEYFVEKIKLDSISLTPATISLTAGFTQQLTATTEPATTGVVLEWSSENPTIASVSGEGLVTAVKAGTTTVKAVGGGVEASVKVTVAAVVIPLQNIKTEPETITLKVDAIQTITVTLVPENATNINVTFESSNESIATVDEAGQVKGIGLGSTVIKVKGGEIVKEIPVTVTFKDITVTPMSALLQLNEELQLEVATVPAGASDVTFEYKSSNEAAVTVSNTGLVKAIGYGDGAVTITVTAGDITKDVSIEIVNPDESQRSAWKSGGASTVWQAGYEVEKAFDGNDNSYWHSDLNGMPQWIIVDMASVKNIDGFTYKARQEIEQPAIPKNMQFETSMDGETWTQVLDLELPNFRGLQVFPLESRVTAQYFRVTVTTNWAGATYTYIAELDIYSGEAPKGDPLPEPEPESEWWTVEASTVIDSWGAAANLVDGEIGTPWHSGTADSQPWAIIDFKESKTLYGLYFTGRQGGPDDIGSSPKHVIFWMSNDKSNWEKFIEIDELPNLRETQTLYADAAKSGRYLKIDIQSTWNGAPYSYIGEIGINDIGFDLTSYPLTFTENTNNMTLEQHDGYVILKGNGGGDPFIYTTPLPADLGAATATIRMEYKCSEKITTGEWFFFGSSHYSTGENLVIEKTDNWRVWTLNFEIKNNLGAGSPLRFDLPNGFTTDFYIRNLEVVVSK